MCKPIDNQKGMSLIELLIVVLIMGIVMTAIYSVSLTSQKTTIKELEVVDLQDNLRLAMNLISQDIRRAGFMVSADPISNATASSLRVNTACLTKNYGRITTALVATGADTLTLASTGMSDLFNAGDVVRIIRPPMLLEIDPTGGSATDGIFAVTGTGSGTLTVTGLTAGVQVSPGDIVVGTRPGAPLVNTVDYTQSGRNLIRTVNGISQYVTNITGLAFTYTLDEDDRIKNVTVNLTGTTNPNVKTIRMKTQELSSSVTVRNL